MFDSSGIRAEVIVVDDGSPDGTGQYVEERSAREPWVRVVRRSGKLGLTSAVVAGFAVAEGEIVGVMDADLSHPPSAVPRMLDAVQGEVDFVIGSRYVKGGGTEGWPLSRRIVSRTGCMMATPFTPVKDSMSGFFLIRRECLTGVELTAKGFKIALDLLVRANYRAVKEVPIRFVDRRYGESKISRGEVFNLLRSLAGYAIAGESGRRRRARTQPEGMGRWQIPVVVLLLVLLLWGLTDVRKRARVDPAHPESHRSDVTVFTGGGAAFFQEGVDPYLVTSPRGWHYLYPPLFGIAVSPLDRLPGSEQGFIFYLISILLLYGSLAETSRIVALTIPGIPGRRLAVFDAKIPRWIVWSAVVAVLFPLLNCLQRGQVAPFTIYPLLLGTRIVIEKRSWRGLLVGGIVLALPVAIKLTPALPVAFVGWVLWLRVVQGLRAPDIRARLRDAGGATAGVGAGLVVWLLLVPAAFVGWSANLGHLSTWVRRVAANRKVDEANDFFAASRRNQSFHNGVRLLVGTLRDEPAMADAEAPGRRYRSEMNAAVPNADLDRGLFLARVAMILLLLGGGLRLARMESGLALAAAMGLGAIGSVVFSPLSWGHHYGIVWPGIVFVPILYWMSGRESVARRLAIAAATMSVGHYLFTGPLGSIGLLGIGTAVWFVAAIVLLPRGAAAVEA